MPNFSLSPRSGLEEKGALKSLDGTFLGRVVKVILSPEDPEYDIFGGEESIGCILYTKIGRPDDTEDPSQNLYAAPLSNHIRTYPLPNEIVVLTTALDGRRDDRDYKTYYTDIVSVFNNPNHNAVPPTYDKVDLGKNVEEKSINTLAPFEGDTIIEGRLGQSIRIGGYKHPSNILTDKNNNGKPFIIIKNGQPEIEDTVQSVTEDINQDDSSIYILSDHTAPVIPSREKYDSAFKDPADPGKYKGNQIIINSGRLYFNAKEEDIQFTSKESFGVSSLDVSIDAKEYIGLDAKKIYLGAKARRLEHEPVILGDALESHLASLYVELRRFCNSVTALKGKPPGVFKGAKTLKAAVGKLKRNLNPGGKRSTLKSRKTFTE